MQQVAPGIYALAGLKTGRAYLVEGDDGLLLVDTSSHSASGPILAAIAAAGFQPADLKMIVATHYHLDHIGNVQELVQHTGAQLLVHGDDVPYVEGDLEPKEQPFPFSLLGGLFMRQPRAPVDRPLKDGDVLPFAGGLRVIHAPGHTPGHIALYAPQRRALFTGDALMNFMGLRLPFSMSTHDMAQARRSVARLAELEYDVALPGHGSPILNHASEKIAEWCRAWVDGA